VRPAVTSKPAWRGGALWGASRLVRPSPVSVAWALLRARARGAAQRCVYRLLGPRRRLVWRARAAFQLEEEEEGGVLWVPRLPW